MSKRRFLHQLAVERCQHNLAQLCAVAHVDSQHKDREADTGGGPCVCCCQENREMVSVLIEAIGRDLQFINTLSEYIEEPLPVTPVVKANER